MSSLEAVKCNLFKVSTTEAKEDSTAAHRRRTKLYEIVKTNQEASMQELHQNRLKSLRKELDYLEKTAWKYEPIEKYIGQSAQQF